MSNTTKQLNDYHDMWQRPGFLIRRLHQIHVAMFLEECEEFNITPVQFGVLTVLYNRETLDQVSIANQIGTDRNTAADVIRRLERRGLLERPVSLTDKRTKLAKITDQGCAFVDAVEPAMIRAQRRFANPLNKEEKATLTALLQKLMLGNNEAGRAPLRTASKSLET